MNTPLFWALLMLGRANDNCYWKKPPVMRR